jgi:hypothetical protein
MWLLQYITAKMAIIIVQSEFIHFVKYANIKVRNKMYLRVPRYRNVKQIGMKKSLHKVP